MTDLQGTIGSRRHGINVVTFTTQLSSQFTVPPAAQRKLLRWARANSVTLHTVAVDHRAADMPSTYTGHELYYQRGVLSGTLGGMMQARGPDDLRRLVSMSSGDLAREQTRRRRLVTATAWRPAMAVTGGE